MQETQPVKIALQCPLNFQDQLVPFSTQAPHLCIFVGHDEPKDNNSDDKKRNSCRYKTDTERETAETAQIQVCVKPLAFCGGKFKIKQVVKIEKSTIYSESTKHAQKKIIFQALNVP